MGFTRPPEPALSNGGGGRVVVRRRGDAEALFQSPLEVHFVPALQIGRVMHDAAFGVEGAGACDSQAHEGVLGDARARDETGDGFGNRSKGRFRRLSGNRGVRAAVEDLAGEIDDDQAGLPAVDLNPDGVTGFGIDAQTRPGLSGRGHLPSGLLYEAFLQQPANDVRHRLRRQPRAAGYLGPAGALVQAYCLQHDAPVVAADPGEVCARPQRLSVPSLSNRHSFGD